MKTKTKSLITGEYVNVAKKTTKFDLLRFAHENDFIDRDQARLIVYARNAGLKVRFNGYRGRCPAHRQWITLPRGNDVKSNGIHGRLRVGIVLHELAHYENAVKPMHGPAFIEKLDALVEWWYVEGGNNAKNMEEDLYGK